MYDDYIPYQRESVAGKGMKMHPKQQPIAPNLLGVATKKGLPRPSFPGKYNKGLLQYPQNVTDGLQQGHYILFHVSVVDKAKIKETQARNKRIAKTEKEFKRRAELNNTAATNEQAVAEAKTSMEMAGGKDAQTIEQYKKDKAATAASASNESSSLQISAGRKRLATTIALYMPPTVTVNYAADWAEGEITARGRIAAAGLQALNSGINKDTVNSLVGAVESGGKQMLLGALDAAAPGAKGLIAIEQGKIMTNRMEVMFNGIGRRSFEYSFKFIPKNAEEAKTIEEIVHTFKLHAASEMVKGSGGKEYTIPNMFDIEYMWLGTRNEHLNKIGTSALTSISITYGGEKYVTYGDGVPQSTEMSLSFTEMELMDKAKIREGY